MLVGVKTQIPKDTQNVEICTLKLGEDEWQNMSCPVRKAYPWVSLGPGVLHRGLIYFVNRKGDVATLDIKQGLWDANYRCLGREITDTTSIKAQYLVKVNGEEDALLGVFVFGEERRVNVFRLSSEMKWDLVEDGIGDKVLYLSNKSSFGYKARTKSMENTVYLPMSSGVDDRAGVFYSLSDGKYRSLDGDCLGDDAYGLKRYEFAAWVMPMPTPEEVVTTLSWL